jgi:hypothetical protein
MPGNERNPVTLDTLTTLPASRQGGQSFLHEYETRPQVDSQHGVPCLQRRIFDVPVRCGGGLLQDVDAIKVVSFRDSLRGILFDRQIRLNRQALNAGTIQVVL